MSPTTKPKTIRMKERIANDVRTPGKDNAAEYIQEEVIDAGRWPLEYSQMADECGWSRQHIRNTIRDYFVEVDNGGYETEPKADGKGEAKLRGRTLDIPDDVESVDDYLRGVIDGSNLP